MIRPPSTGPRTGPTSAGSAITAVTRPSGCPAAARMIMVCMTGSIRPPPAPCRTRNAIRLGASQARLAATEPTKKIVKAQIQTVLPP
jgi:hypothetical protein